MKKVAAPALSALLLAVLVVPTLVLAQGNVPNFTGGKIGQTFAAIVTFMNSVLEIGRAHV